MGDLLSYLGNLLFASENQPLVYFLVGSFLLLPSSFCSNSFKEKANSKKILSALRAMRNTRVH